jgi:hypothetical protein
VTTPNLCSHAHTHITHISKLKKIEISHTLTKWGSGSRKKKRTNLRLGHLSAGVDSHLDHETSFFLICEETKDLFGTCFHFVFWFHDFFKFSRWNLKFDLNLFLKKKKKIVLGTLFLNHILKHNLNKFFLFGM